MAENDSAITENESQMNQNQSATAALTPTQDSDVKGTVTFSKSRDGIQVEATLMGLGEGMHGFHIHETGDCSAPDASSAGGHFNPAGNEHGARTDSERHMGDMGNIEADAEGNATVNFTDSVITFDQIMGKAVILHSGEDDLTSQPSGAAGNRMACGVIESAGSESMDSGMEDDNM
jgi:Cu-Zn family superoxide dismutase